MNDLQFYLRLAWRNLWRNKKRTLIASGSVFFAVILSVCSYSIKIGQFEQMVHSSVSFTTGHIQIHGSNFWERRSLDQSMALTPSLLPALRAIAHVRQVAPRLETVALVSRGIATRVSPIIGIDPASEHGMSRLGTRIVQGISLDRWTGGMLIAEGLAVKLSVSPGDSILVYGQGYQGVTVARLIPVAGIVRFPVEAANNSTIYLRLEEEQDLLEAPGRVTSVSLLLDADREIASVLPSVRTAAGAECEVMTWREMLPELLQAVSIGRGSMMVIMLILYLIVGFGIFGTIMMMTTERMREFGVTIAVGMRRTRLMIVTAVESVTIALLGALCGIGIAIPLLLFFAAYPIRLGGDFAKTMTAYGLEPILPVSTDPSVFIFQGIAVFLIGAASAAYPAMVLKNLQPVQAMRGQ